MTLMIAPAFSRLMLLLLLSMQACGPTQQSHIGTLVGTMIGTQEFASARVLEEAKCAGSANLSCFKLSLPISGGDAGGHELVVTFAVHEATKANREALLLIGGGPGEPVIKSVGEWFPSIDPRLLDSHDVVTFDLRGAFHSGDHGCPKADDIWQQQTFTAKTPQQRLELLRAAKTFAFACAAELGIDATDLPYYNSLEAAHDIEAFRRIRGYDHWTIYAYSYGTQLAQIYAGLFPERVKNMALDGAVDLHLLCDTPDTHDSFSDPAKSLDRNDRGIYYLFICNDYGRGGLSDSERVKKFEALADHVEGGDHIIRSPGYSELPCMVWPSAPAIAPKLPPVNYTVPTLMIAATMDAAVPFEQSLSLLERSPSASLIQVEGGQHIMYGNGNDCVDDAVNIFLLRGEQPEDKILRCPA